MTRSEYTKRYAADLQAFLATEAGQNLMPTLAHLAPPLVPPMRNENGTALVEAHGCRRGYEMALGRILSLTTVDVPKNDVEALYGVPEIPNPTPKDLPEPGSE